MNGHTHTQEESYVAETQGHALQGLAKYYDIIVGVLTLGQEKKFREGTLDAVEITPGMHILEAGCGTGTLALAARKRMGTVGHVAGIDPSSNMIDAARAKAGKAQLEVDFDLGVMEKLDFEDNTFDLVLNSLVMHHLPDDALKRAAIAEVLRVLKPGGVLLIVDMDPTGVSLVNMLHGGGNQKASPQEKNKQYMLSAGYAVAEIGKLKTGKYYTLMGKKAE